LLKVQIEIEIEIGTGNDPDTDPDPDPDYEKGRLHPVGGPDFDPRVQRKQNSIALG